MIKKIQLNRALVSSYTLQKHLFFILFSVFVASFLLYMFFVMQTVFTIVERKNIENNLRILNTTIGDLELEYLSLEGTINLEMSRTLGFHEPQIIYFAPRNTLVSGNSLLTNEL